MNKRTVYTGELVQSPDFLTIQQNTEVALAFLNNACIGDNGQVQGLNIVPTGPVSNQVQMLAGAIYQLIEADSTPWSDLGIDTHTEVYQAIQRDPITLPTAYGAPTGPNQQIVYTLQGEIVQVDDTPTLLPFFNSANPTMPVYGAGGGLLPIDRDYIVNTDVLVGSTFTAPVIVNSDFTPVGNSPVIVQFAPASADNVTTFNISLTNPPTAGNSLYVLLAADSSTSQATSVMIGANSFTLIERHNTTNNVEIWQLQDIPSALGTTITVNTSASPNSFIAFGVEAFNVETSGSVDQFTGNNGNSTTPDSGTTAATSQDDELFLAILQQTGAGQTFTAPTHGFTLMAQQDDTGNNIHAAALFKSAIVTGTANTSVTSSSSANWEGAIATFKAAPGGGSLPPGVYGIMVTYLYSGVINGESQPSTEIFVTIDTGNTSGSITYNVGPMPVGVMQANVYITDTNGAPGTEKFSQSTTSGTGTITVVPAMSAQKVPKHATAPDVSPGFVCLAMIAMSTGQTTVNTNQIFDCRPTFLTLPEIAQISAGTFVAGVTSISSISPILVNGDFGPATGNVVISSLPTVEQLIAGTYISLSPTSGVGNVTINANPPVTQLLAGSGIQLSPSDGLGNVTISWVPPASAPVVTQIVPGTGISVSPPGGQGIVTVTNTLTATDTNHYNGNGQLALFAQLQNLSSGSATNSSGYGLPSGPFQALGGLVGFYPLTGSFINPAETNVTSYTGNVAQTAYWLTAKDLRYNESALAMIAPKTGTIKNLRVLMVGTANPAGLGNPSATTTCAFTMRVNGNSVEPSVSFQLLAAPTQLVMSLQGATGFGQKAFFGTIRTANFPADSLSLSSNLLVLPSTAVISLQGAPTGGLGVQIQDTTFVPTGSMPTGSPNVVFPAPSGPPVSFYVELQNLTTTAAVNAGDLLALELFVSPNSNYQFGLTGYLFSNLRVGAYSIELV